MVDTVTIQGENTGPTLEEQAAAQEAAAQAASGAEPKLAGETAQRPDNVPEKFWDAEKGEVNTAALLASYSELERGNSTPAEPKPAATDDAAAQAVSNAGLDMAALQAEYNTNGSLTDESLATLAKSGISKDMVDQYIAGAEAQNAAVQAELLEPVGGNMETYDEMIAWAGDNLDDGQIDDFNTVLETGNTAAIKLAVKNLSDQYTAANGTEPGRQLNGKAAQGASGVYESTADLMKDMQNPEYDKNPAFRAKVEAKLARSSIL